MQPISGPAPRAMPLQLKLFIALGVVGPLLFLTFVGLGLFATAGSQSWEVSSARPLSPQEALRVSDVLKRRAAHLGSSVFVKSRGPQLFFVRLHGRHAREEDVASVLTARGTLEVFLVENRTRQPAQARARGDVLLPNPNDRAEYLVVSRPPELAAWAIEDVRLGDPKDGRQSLLVRLTPESGAVLRPYTRSHIGRSLAFAFDGSVLAVPVIRDEMGTDVVISAIDAPEPVGPRELVAILGGGAFPEHVRLTARQVAAPE